MFLSVISFMSSKDCTSWPICCTCHRRHLQLSRLFTLRPTFSSTLLFRHHKSPRTALLRRHYAANSGKSLPTFRYKLSAPSSKINTIRMYRISRNSDFSNPSKRVTNLGTDWWSRTVGKELPQRAA